MPAPLGLRGDGSVAQPLRARHEEAFVAAAALAMRRHDRKGGKHHRLGRCRSWFCRREQRDNEPVCRGLHVLEHAGRGERSFRQLLTVGHQPQLPTTPVGPVRTQVLLALVDGAIVRQVEMHDVVL